MLTRALCFGLITVLGAIAAGVTLAVAQRSDYALLIMGAIVPVGILLTAHASLVDLARVSASSRRRLAAWIALCLALVSLLALLASLAWARPGIRLRAMHARETAIAAARLDAACALARAS
ncbi:MAG: hypothetical protein MUF51_10525 [Vicinamibacteria bacterium]|jgi:hypothetical protein|nr:hypothetical protein [Vicinamibacteria bacterium]